MLLPLNSVGPLRRTNICLTIVGRTKHCSCDGPTALFALDSVNISTRHCRGHLSVFARDLRGNTTRRKVRISLLGRGKRALARTADSTRKRIRLRGSGGTTLLLTHGSNRAALLSLGLPTLSLTRFGVTNTPNCDGRFFVFNPHSLCHPNRAMVLGNLLHSTSNGTLPGRPVGLSIVGPSKRMLEDIIDRPRGNLCRFA